jgi:hypothetical protein
MQDILKRLADSSANEGSHELQCRCFDAAKEIRRLRSLANLTDVLECTIAEAESYAAHYDGDDRQDIKTDVLNAFYAGAKFGKNVLTPNE